MDATTKNPEICSQACMSVNLLYWNTLILLEIVIPYQPSCNEILISLSATFHPLDSRDYKRLLSLELIPIFFFE
jgi:hypothetical protein